MKGHHDYVLSKILYRKGRQTFHFHLSKLSLVAGTKVRSKPSSSVVCMQAGKRPQCDCFAYLCQGTCKHVRAVMRHFVLNVTEWIQQTSEQSILTIISEFILPVIDRLVQPEQNMVRNNSNTSLESLRSTGGAKLACCFCLEDLRHGEKHIKCKTCKLILHDRCWVRWHMTSHTFSSSCPWCTTQLEEPRRFEGKWNKDTLTWDIVLYHE